MSRTWQRTVASWESARDAPWLQAAQRNCRVGACHLDLGARRATVSKEFLDVLGIEHDAFRTDEHAISKAIHPDDRSAFKDAQLKILSGETITGLRLRIGTGDSFRWVAFQVCHPSEQSGYGSPPQHAVCTVTDVDDLVRAELQLTAAQDARRRAEQFQAAVIASTPDAIHILDVESHTLTRASRKPGNLIGFTTDEDEVLAGTNVDELIPAEDRLHLAEVLEQAMQLPDLGVAQIRHRVLTRDGQVLWLERRLSVFDRDEQGRPISFVIVSSDVTNLVTAEQRHQHATTHDDLTGLANRGQFLSEVEGRLRNGDRFAVLALNVDGFKAVNNSHGRAAGDSVLKAVARRLCAAVRRQDVVARISGDEFVLLTSDPEDTRRPGATSDTQMELQADHIARRIEDLMSEPFHLADAEITLTVSIGICVATADVPSEAMLRAANAAMDQVKRSGESGHRVFDEALAEEARMLEHVERNLRRALRDDELEVYYQPVVASDTHTVQSVEALVRLRDETGKMLPVDTLISVAERCSLVAEMDDQVLRKACRQVALWRREPRYADLHLALNRSAKDLNRPGFHQRVLRRLLASELPPHALTLEITESVLLHVSDERIDEIKKLCDSSIKLAIDDFGTGYASMSQLLQLPISTIKIDRSFTARMLQDATCAALVRATVGLAADLDYDCVVEGVETIDQLEALPSYARLQIQGYLFGRPRSDGEGLGVTQVRSVITQ